LFFKDFKGTDLSTLQRRNLFSALPLKGALK
jgi:hypothetical protein